MAGERYILKTTQRMEQPGMKPVVWSKETPCVNIGNWVVDLSAGAELLLNLDSVAVAAITCPVIIAVSDVPGPILLPINSASPALPTDWTGARELNCVFVGQETSFSIANKYAVALKNPTSRNARVTIRFGRCS